MLKCMYMFCMKYVEMQAHEVYEMYNKIEFFVGVFDIYLLHPPTATGLLSKNRMQPSLNIRH
jgi:hypothetical protein